MKPCDSGSKFRIKKLAGPLAPIRFGTFNNLSELASAAAKMQRQFCDAWEHIDDFGSGHEYGGLLRRAQEKAWASLLADAGLTSDDELYRLIAERTRERWVYFQFVDTPIGFNDVIFGKGHWGQDENNRRDSSLGRA